MSPLTSHTRRGWFFVEHLAGSWLTGSPSLRRGRNSPLPCTAHRLKLSHWLVSLWPALYVRAGGNVTWQDGAAGLSGERRRHPVGKWLFGSKWQVLARCSMVSPKILSSNIIHQVSSDWHLNPDSWFIATYQMDTISSHKKWCVVAPPYDSNSRSPRFLFPSQSQETFHMLFFFY